MNPTLRNRIISAVVGIIVIVSFLILKGWFVIVPSSILAFIGVYEFNRAFKNIDSNPMFIAGTILSLFAISSYVLGPSRYALVAMVSLLFFFSLLAYYVFSKHTIIDIFVTVFSVFYVTVPFVLIMALSDRSDKLLWSVFTIAFATDSCAYFIGKRFGKHKLIVAVSPNKTVEGAIGGVLGSLFSMIVFKFIIMPEMSWLLALSLGLLGSIASQVGDLTASKIKRHCKVKDFGTIIPGHGGVLDRFDSILFTTPAVFFIGWMLRFI